IKSKLTSWQKVRIIDFVCDQVDRKGGAYASVANTIYVDETWFYVMADGVRVRVFLYEDDSDLPGSPTVQHKSHIPKTMIIAANAHSDSAHSFDGKLGVWHMCAPKTADRTSKNHKKGDVYEQDCTLDHLWYKKWYTEELLPAIKTKMPWLQGKHVFVQQGSATPHMGKGDSEIISGAGKTEGWSIRLVTQPSNSPDLNMMDLCFFRSLKCRVMG
ncbi:unnamed protein product, partial [Choristocarpus tenellus]